MRILIAFCLCGLAIPLPAQTTLRTFTSPDGIFRFEYSGVLVDCLSEQPQANSITSGVPQVFVGDTTGSSVPDSCISQGGICSDGGSGASTVACFAYPKDEFRDKPTFVAAAFFVAELAEATSRKACSEGSPYWNVEGVESTTINGARFKVFHSTDAGLGHSQDDHLYRTFHHKKCYELGIQSAFSNPGAYDPDTIEEFTNEDWDEVESHLKQALNSFRFVK